MPIKGFEVTAIDGRRFTKPGEKIRGLRIDHNSTVTLIQELTDKEASVDFRFTVTFQGVGVIRIEGNLVFLGDAREMTKMWSTQNKMPNEVASEIHSTIMMNCIPEAVIVARELRLPPPIPIPQVNLKGEGKPSAGSGVEVA